jgi:hypothetical protein
MILLLSLFGGIFDRLRGYDPADQYEQRGETPPKLAKLIGDFTSRGIMAVVMASIIVGYACVSGDHSAMFLGMLFTLIIGSLWFIGSGGRSRTYSAYDATYSTDDDFTRVVGRLIPGDIPLVNRVRGMIETAFYGALISVLPYAYLFYSGYLQALPNFAAFCLMRGVGKGLVGFIPASVRFPDYNWKTKKITFGKMNIRTGVAEYIEGVLYIYWLTYTII